MAGQINFTAGAKPDQVGSGLRAINTLFHEGGHAAHFANVTQNSPCFSQEFSPTSMAYAETQSMFCDSLLADACNMSVDEAWDAARRSMDVAAARSYPQDYPADLDATIRIVHGAEVLADNTDSEEKMCRRFEHWVAERFPANIQ